MERGLAATVMPQEGDMEGGMPEMGQPEPQQTIPPDVIEDVVRLLLQGATPQDLINGGIPPEVIEAAIEVLEAQQERAGMPTNESVPMGAGNPQPQDMLGQGLASQAF